MHLYSIPFSNLLDPGTAVERFVFRKVGVKKKQKKKNGSVPADPETAVEDEPHCYLPNSPYWRILDYIYFRPTAWRRRNTMFSKTHYVF